MMSTWSKDELQRISTNDDLHISPFREDGTPTWIWSVAVGEELFVRAYNGQKSRWYQAAIHQKGGRITAAGMTREVTFEPVNGASNDRIDDALPREVQRQPLSQLNDRRPSPRGDAQGCAALNRETRS